MEASQAPKGTRLFARWSLFIRCGMRLCDPLIMTADRRSLANGGLVEDAPMIKIPDQFSRKTTQ